MAKSAAGIATKWAQRLAGAGESIREGVNNVVTSPGEAAIAAKTRYLDGVNRAYNDGSYERGLRSFTLEGWKQNTLTKGIPRIASGAQAALPKVQRYMEFLMPQMEELQRRIAGMPKGSLQDSQMRAAAAIAFMAGLKGKAPRG